MEDNPSLGEEPEVRPRTREGNPRPQGDARAPITRERIAERAYLIWQSEQAGSDDDENWHRAERELMKEQEPEEG
jgi:hypothetical protein